MPSTRQARATIGTTLNLAAFARTGDPNGPAALGVTWPAWPSTLIFDATPSAKATSVR